VRGEDRLRVGAGEEGEELGRGLGVGSVAQRDGRVGRHDVDLVGQVDAVDVVSREDVGDVDDASVGLAQRDLREDAADVLLLAGPRDGQPRVGEGLRGVAPAGHLGRAQGYPGASRADVGHGPDPGRVPLGHDDLQPIAREDDRVTGAEAPADHLVEVGLVGAGEHVGRRALDDLRGEGRGRVEAQLDLDVRVLHLEGGGDVLEGLAQGRGGQDGQSGGLAVPVVAPTTGGRTQGAHQGQEPAGEEARAHGRNLGGHPGRPVGKRNRVP
jgi:hypothetical protein